MWNHDISTAPRDGSRFLMATTDGKRYLTRWLKPTKFTPSGRFDGFSENAKTLLAWCAVPDHPFQAKASDDNGATGQAELTIDQLHGDFANTSRGADTPATISPKEAEEMSRYTTRGNGIDPNEDRREGQSQVFADRANAGGGHVTDGENAQPDKAGERVVSSPDIIVHKHIFLDDVGGEV